MPIYTLKVTHTYSVIIAILLVSIVEAGFFSKKAVLVKSVQYRECPDYNGFISFNGAQVTSTENGDLIVSGDASTALNITSPVQASVSAARSVLGLWVPVPCIMMVGSCTYPDLCQYGLSDTRTCPGALDENDVPCRCPIQQGVYNLPGAQFPIPTTRLAGLLAGNYKATIRITSHNRLLACFKVKLQLQ